MLWWLISRSLASGCQQGYPSTSLEQSVRLPFSRVRQHLDTPPSNQRKAVLHPCVHPTCLFWFTSEEPCVVAVVNRSVAIASVGGQPAVLNGSLMADEDSGRLLQLVLSVAARDC